MKKIFKLITISKDGGLVTLDEKGVCISKMGDFSGYKVGEVYDTSKFETGDSWINSDSSKPYLGRVKGEGNEDSRTNEKRT